ncbi:MAG: hypothetical protein KAG56_09730 [Sulfurovaceae bacterium]|nr:hypothetical protein [Sulfurovaceae bacterium]
MQQKKRMLIIITGSLFFTILYAGENIYLGDKFNERHSDNDSFTKVIVKNRVYNDVGGASYTKIDGKEELQEALLSGELDQESTGSRITKEYKLIEIENANINQNDLKNMKGEELLIGTRIKDEQSKIMQSISIKNSKINTNKHINVGIISSAKNNNGINSMNRIERSSLIGGKHKEDSSIENRESISLFDD